MTDPQQPELRRSDESTTSEQRTEDAGPTSAPGSHDRTADSPVPRSQMAPYGPSGRTASDGS